MWNKSRLTPSDTMQPGKFVRVESKIKMCWKKHSIKYNKWYQHEKVTNGTRAKISFLHLVLVPQNNFETAVLRAVPIERPGAFNLRDLFALDGTDSERSLGIIAVDGANSTRTQDILAVDGATSEWGADSERALDILVVYGADSCEHWISLL